jgi:hypothetical protein
VKYTFAVVVIACAACSLVQGQTASSASPSAAPTKDPVATSLRALLQRSRNNTLGALSAMPADKFSYKPTPEQMSFAHLAAHIIEFNNSFCAKAADVAAPKVEEAKETDSKDKLVAAATGSYDFCGEVLSKMDDSKLGDTIEIFDGSADFGKRLGGSLFDGCHLFAAEWYFAAKRATEEVELK